MGIKTVGGKMTAMVAKISVPPPIPMAAVNRLAIKETEHKMAKSEKDKLVPSRIN
jgi:hypothetical protein|tara:strand:+ start:30 stop:194 length:165 start_codon:yes stop_codon:yes gene_type:complete